MMNDYNGLSMSPNKMKKMLVELYDGKRFKRGEAIEKIRKEFIEQGGIIKDNYNMTSCFKIACKLLQKEGVIDNLDYGLWEIKTSSGEKATEAELPEEQVEVLEESRMVNGNTIQIGEGSGEVYVYYYPAYKELADLKGETTYPCKVGMTENGSINRVKDQHGTAMPELPYIGLIIHSNKARALEKTIHDALKYKECQSENSIGEEWFDTSIEMIQDICRPLMK